MVILGLIRLEPEKRRNYLLKAKNNKKEKVNFMNDDELKARIKAVGELLKDLPYGKHSNVLRRSYIQLLIKTYPSRAENEKGMSRMSDDVNLFHMTVLRNVEGCWDKKSAEEIAQGNQEAIQEYYENTAFKRMMEI